METATFHLMAWLVTDYGFHPHRCLLPGERLSGLSHQRVSDVQLGKLNFGPGPRFQRATSTGRGVKTWRAFKNILRMVFPCLASIRLRYSDVNYDKDSGQSRRSVHRSCLQGRICVCSTRAGTGCIDMW